jgi:hypothetical protein
LRQDRSGRGRTDLLQEDEETAPQVWLKQRETLSCYPKRRLL